MDAADGEQREIWRIGDLTLDVGQQRVWREGAPIDLPKLSFDLLLTLARRAPDVLTYDELMNRVWPGLVVSPETVVQRVRLLRAAIGDDAASPRYVEALRSRGYRLRASAERMGPGRAAAAPPAAALAAPSHDRAADPAADTATCAQVGEAAAAPAGAMPDPPAGAMADAAAASAPSPPGPSIARWLAASLAVALVLGGALWFGGLGGGGARTAPSVSGDPSAATAPGLVNATAAQERAERAAHTAAVLPFENLSTDERDAFIAEAVAESTLDRLSALRGLVVIARDSAWRAGAMALPARETGARLGAAWLVEGSVRRDGALVRVSARLVDARTDAQVWAERYDRPLAALPQLQDEIAARVVDALAARLAGLQRTGQGRDYSHDVDANLAYLRGRALIQRFTVAEAEAAAAQFADAIARDPDFAAAYAALYDARMQAVSLRREGVAAARVQYAALIARALQLDPRCGAAYLARARWSDGSPAAREADFLRGLELEPSNARGIGGYAEFLQFQGRGAESARWLQRELLVDPLSAPAYFREAMQTLSPAGAGVERAMLAVLERDPAFYPALHRYAKYRWMLDGEIAQAIEIIERAIAIDPANPWGRHLAATFYLDVGDPLAARDVAGGTPVSAASTRTLLALYDARDTLAAREVYAPQAQLFNVLESWGMAEALRDAALRDGARPGSRWEQELARRFAPPARRHLAAQRKSLGPGDTGIDLNNYRGRILLAQLRLQRGEQAAARTELHALIAWMDANERMGLQHAPRAQALMLLGETDRALEELAAAFEKDRDYRQWWYVLRRDPIWSTVRSDPRFRAIGDEVRAYIARERAKLEALRLAGKVPDRGHAAPVTAGR
ncbi:MAG: winged helix-turn-helix domain-containing protein [Steroidobacteraceae bacterium]